MQESKLGTMRTESNQSENQNVKSNAVDFKQNCLKKQTEIKFNSIAKKIEDLKDSKRLENKSRSHSLPRSNKRIIAEKLKETIAEEEDFKIANEI